MTLPIVFQNKMSCLFQISCAKLVRIDNYFWGPFIPGLTFRSPEPICLECAFVGGSYDLEYYSTLTQHFTIWGIAKVFSGSFIYIFFSYLLQKTSNIAKNFKIIASIVLLVML